jgi:hypothetical protein
MRGTVVGYRVLPVDETKQDREAISIGPFHPMGILGSVILSNPTIFIIISIPVFSTAVDRKVCSRHYLQ